LFLDSDAFPVHDPDILFDSEPFNSTGLVLWPDFWYASESPAYFAISSQKMPSLKERQCTESGEMVYSKSKHELSLLLAAYYNTETGSIEGSAMVQYDPREDYIATQESKPNSFGRVAKNNSVFADPAAAPDAKPFFVHAQLPEIQPPQLSGLILDRPEIQTARRLGPLNLMWSVGSGRKSKWTSCELETKFDSWRGVGGNLQCCDNVLERGFRTALSRQTGRDYARHDLDCWSPSQRGSSRSEAELPSSLQF
jgi:alpha 1,2-mannosyltransferase